MTGPQAAYREHRQESNVAVVGLHEIAISSEREGAARFMLAPNFLEGGADLAHAGIIEAGIAIKRRVTGGQQQNVFSRAAVIAVLCPLLV